MARTLTLMLASTAVAQPVPPYPLAGDLATARAFAASAQLQRPTGLARNDYLDTINGIVQAWRGQQASNGSIIDPFTNYEMQYSTPCFAFSAALLYTTGIDTTLLAPAVAALSFSIASMLNGSEACAQATCDFYPTPVMHAYTLLRDIVSPAQSSAWATSLAAINVTRTYELHGNNWELVAAAGEYMRSVGYGWGNWSYWDARIVRQVDLQFWTANGEYADNNGMDKTSPMPYDMFATGYMTLLYAQGYTSGGWSNSDYFAAMLPRAAWTHALMQSPIGEIAVGGRSSQLQWNEAVAAASYELMANVMLPNGSADACLFTRAARLSHASVRRWRQEPSSGAIQIIKNWFPPEDRWGYDSYAFYSQYSLLPAAWLSLAYTYASDAASECATFADVGGYVFALSDDKFRKVFAHAQGTYIEMIVGADPEYESTGLCRWHVDACALQPAGSNCTSMYPLLGPSGCVPLQLGSAWSTGVYWSFADAPNVLYSLANSTLADIPAAVLTPGAFNSPTNVSFTLEYVLFNAGVLVVESYVVTPGLVNVTATVTQPSANAMLHRIQHARACHGVSCTLIGGTSGLAPRATAPRLLTRFGVQFPVFLYDGRTNTTVVPPASTSPRGVASSIAVSATGAGTGDAVYSMLPSPAQSVNWTWVGGNVTAASRNGVLGLAMADVAGVEGHTGAGVSYSLSVSMN